MLDTRAVTHSSELNSLCRLVPFASTCSARPSLLKQKCVAVPAGGATSSFSQSHLHLPQEWSPALTIRTALLSIQALFLRGVF